MAEWKQKRAFLFSHPRTTSNLLTKILSGQPYWKTSDYLFFDAFQYTRDAFEATSLENVPSANRQEHQRLIDAGKEQLDEVLKTSLESRRHLLLKDHAHLVLPVEITYGDFDSTSHQEDSRSARYDSPLDQDDEPTAVSKRTSTNPTIFSDDLMLSWTPIILIRNPILVYESWLRAEGTPYPHLESQYAKIYTTLNFQRRIFDWYQTRSSHQKAVIIDADDVITNRLAMEKLCDAIGMSKEQLVYHWKPSPIPQKFMSNERFRRFVQTAWESTGIDYSKTSHGVTLESRRKDWDREFGPERADVLRRRVRVSWADYEFLRERRIQ